MKVWLQLRDSAEQTSAQKHIKQTQHISHAQLNKKSEKKKAHLTALGCSSGEATTQAYCKGNTSLYTKVSLKDATITSTVCNITERAVAVVVVVEARFVPVGIP